MLVFNFSVCDNPEEEKVEKLESVLELFPSSTNPVHSLFFIRKIAASHANELWYFGCVPCKSSCYQTDSREVIR